VGFPASGRTIAGSIRRRIPTGTAASEGVGATFKSAVLAVEEKRTRSYTEGSRGKSQG
jgi:hypothetical protein